MDRVIEQLAFLHSLVVAAEREKARLEARLKVVPHHELHYVWQGIFEQTDSIAENQAAIRPLLDAITAHSLTWCHDSTDCPACVEVTV